MNPTIGKRYRCITSLLPGMSPLTFVSGAPRWCSYNRLLFGAASSCPEPPQASPGGK